MKKLILFISLFLAGSSVGQTIFITNNTGNSINYRFYEANCPTTTMSATYGVAAYGSTRHAATTGFDFFAFYSEDAVTNQQAPILTETNACNSNNVLIVSCSLFTIPCTAEWRRLPSGDVEVEFY